jgi:hypothetical protein
VILVDTSVWDHLRAAKPALARLLDRGEVLGHPFVVGEIALGDLRQRERILRALLRLPSAAVATHGEVLHIVEAGALFARGFGYDDVHLLAAASLTARARLWTHDSGCTNSRWGWAWRRSSRNVSNRNHPSRRAAACRISTISANFSVDDAAQIAALLRSRTRSIAKSFVQRPANDQILLIVDPFFSERFDCNMF